MIDSSEFRETDPGMMLSPELSHYISEDNLHTNSKRYQELQVELSPEQQRKVSIIRNRLLEIPLIHATPNPLEQSENILPAIDLPQGGKNTYGLDQSLGLHRYTFFNWGLPEKSKYGRNFVLVKPDVLLSPHTVVTPFDIGEISYVGSTPYGELSSEIQQSYQEKYFDTMVRGKEWLEITARKVLKSYERGEPFFTLHSRGTLGEIKHLGAVDSNKIITQINDKNVKPYYKFLYEHGFSNGHMENARSLLQRTDKRYGVDPLPEECGIDYEEASHYWEKQLG